MSAANFHQRKLLRVIEEERRRLGDELHDSLGQQVTGIAFLSKALEQKISAANYTESAMIAARLVAKANRLTERAGYLAQRLQEPEAISAGEFPETLQNWSRDLREAFGVQCVVALERLELPTGEMATALFRFAREMVHEALARWPRATEIRIEVRQTRGRLRLNVSCERGAAKGKRKTSGLLRLRADLLGASLRLASDNSRWTLRAAVPLISRRR